MSPIPGYREQTTPAAQEAGTGVCPSPLPAATADGTGTETGHPRLKLALGLLLLAATTACGLWLRSGIRWDDEALRVTLGSYYWVFPLTPYLAMQWLGAILFFLVLTISPERWQRRLPRVLHRPASFAGFALLAAFTALHAAGMERTFWQQAVLVLGPALGASWVLWRTEFPTGRVSAVLLSQFTGPPGFPYRMALFALLSLAVTSAIVYGGHPIIVDAQSQVLQARMLLAGMWRLDISQGLRDVIAFPNAVPTVPTYSQYPPGHIFLLLPVLALKLPPTALNVLCGTATALLTGSLARRLGGLQAAIVAGLLLLGSPFFQFTSAGAMNHASTALALTAAASCFFRAVDTNRGRWAAAGGGALGWACITRPLTGASHGAVWALAFAVLVFARLRGRRQVVPDSVHSFRFIWTLPVWVAAGLLLPAALLLFYNTETTGHAMSLGYKTANADLHRIGFRSSGPFIHTPVLALGHKLADLILMNDVLFGWVTGSWIVLAVWGVRTRLSGREMLFLALFLAQAFAYSLYHFHQIALGPRFLYETLPFLTVLASLGLSSALSAWKDRAGLLWLLLVLMAVGGYFRNLSQWTGTFSPRDFDHVRAFVKSHAPYSRPTIIVIPDTYDDKVAMDFSPGGDGKPPLWFIPEKREQAARALPELARYQWLKMFPSDSGAGRSENAGR